MNTRFFTQFAAFVLASFAVLFGLRAAFGAMVVNPWAPQILGGVLLLTLLAYSLTAYATRRSADNFLVAYFGGVALRLLLGIGLVLVYFFRAGDHTGHSLITFLGVFFIGYFSCAAFEIWAIFSNLRPFSGGARSKRRII